MAAITFRAAWCKDNSGLEQDVVKFWRNQVGAMPGMDTGGRLRELCAIAYRADKIVAVSTVKIKFVRQFRSNMALYRCAVAKSASTFPPLSWRITDYTRKVLEQWSLANPDQGVMGLMAVLQARVFVENYTKVVGPANMIFTGFTPSGFPICVAWFKNARVPVEWPPLPLPEEERSTPEDTSQATMSSQPENRGRGQ